MVNVRIRPRLLSGCSFSWFSSYSQAISCDSVCSAECFDAKGNAILNSLFVWQSVAAISVFVAALSTTIHITLFAAHFLGKQTVLEGGRREVSGAYLPFGAFLFAEPVYQAIWTLRNAAATVFLFVLLSMIASLVILL